MADLEPDYWAVLESALDIGRRRCDDVPDHFLKLVLHIPGPLVDAMQRRPTATVKVRGVRVRWRNQQIEYFRDGVVDMFDELAQLGSDWSPEQNMWAEPEQSAPLLLPPPGDASAPVEPTKSIAGGDSEADTATDKGGRPSDKDRIIGKAVELLKTKNYRSRATLARAINRWLQNLPDAVRTKGKITSIETIGDHITEVWKQRAIFFTGETGEKRF